MSRKIDHRNNSKKFLTKLPRKLWKGGISNIDAIERVAPSFPDLLRIYADQVNGKFISWVLKNS